jgi:starch synthase
MEKIKVLFVFQEITPYLPESEKSVVGRYLPQGVQEKGMEIRTFLPRYGLINERRNQLHEVIRLSGMNLVVNDSDHPLIIKVASIQSARMQVYFIDNEDYFQRKSMFADEEGNEFEDNDERIIFYNRGVMETVKKLRWTPDIIHCHGWFTSLIPLYVKKELKDDPLFNEAKVITSIYEDGFSQSLGKTFMKKVKVSGIKDKDISILQQPNLESLLKLSLNMSDGVIVGSPELPENFREYIKASEKPVLEYQNIETMVDSYMDFYMKILAK